jgi:O-antigen ligase
MRSETLMFLAKHFSILIILSFLPYIFGVLAPMGEGYDLSSFGLIGSFGLVGPFLNPHSASLSLAFSMIVISSNIRKENQHRENLFYVLLIALGFYEIMNTYVRTGLVIYLLVLLYLYLREINLKKIFLLIMTAVMMSGVGLYLYKTNDVVRMRLEDRTKYNDGGEAGSGRFEFWRNAVENWADDDMSVIFIGLGEEYAKDKMLEDTGLRIFAHNEFFQMLQQEGLIGFFLFLATLSSIVVFILRHKSSIHYSTAVSIFMGMIIMMSFQGGFYFNIIFFLSIYLALLKQEYII